MNKILTITAVFCICVLMIFLLPTHGEAQVYDSVIRLHVIANSDSEADQALKLKVRDKILGYTNDLIGQAKDIEWAKRIFEENIDNFDTSRVVSTDFDNWLSILTKIDADTTNFDHLRRVRNGLLHSNFYLEQDPSGLNITRIKTNIWNSTSNNSAS